MEREREKKRRGKISFFIFSLLFIYLCLRIVVIKLEYFVTLLFNDSLGGMYETNIILYYALYVDLII